MEGIYEEQEGGYPPERIVRIMADQGEKITLEEAKKMLETMKIFAEITINQYLRDG